MAVYTGFHSILNAALGEYSDKGFRLSEDEHFLYLFYRDERIGVFSAIGATPVKIHDACQEYLDRLSDVEVVG